MSKLQELLQQRQKQMLNLNPLEALQMGVVNTATLGTYPKILSGIQAGISKIGGDEEPYGEIYKKKLKEQRELQKYLQDNYSASNLAGNIVGGAPYAGFTLGASLNPVARGALQGGILGGTEGLLASDEHRLESTIAGGAIGSGFGAGVTFLGGLVGNLLKHGNKKGIPNSIEPSLENPIISEEGGITQVTPGRKIEDIYIDPASGYFAEAAEEFKVPLTKGQLTGDSNTLFKEEAAKLGKFGANIEGQAKTFEKNQNQAIVNATNSLNKKLSGDILLNKGARINEAIEPVLKQAEDEASVFNQLYREVAETPTQVQKNVFDSFGKDFESVIGKEGYTREIDTAKPVFQEIDRLTNILKNNDDLHFSNVFKYREGLNAKINSAKGDEKRLLQGLKRNLDDKLSSIPEEAILNGDLAVLDKYKQANNLYSLWKEKYTPQNSKDYAKKFIEDILENRELYTDETIVNKLFGGSKMGFDSQSAMFVNDIKKRISPEAFKGVQGEALFKIMQPLSDPKNLKADIYNNNLKNLLKNNSSLMKSLFTNQELKGLKKLGELSARTKIRPFSKINPSGTAPFKDYLKGLAKKIPGTSELIDSWGANVNFKNNQVEELIKNGIKIPKDLTPIERILYIGGISNITQELATANQKKPAKTDVNPLNNLSDEELRNYIKPSNKSKPAINSLGDLQNLSNEELEALIKGY